MLPHEIHVTVKTGDIKEFTEACREAKVKPILLHLHYNGGEFSDLQTSSIYTGHWHEVLKEVTRIETVLKEYSFEPIRSKIESPPWHEMAPTLENKQYMPIGSYFETHIAVELSPCVDEYYALKAIAEKYKAHVSRNIFKITKASDVVYMVTLREHTEPYETFVWIRDKLQAELEANDFLVTSSVVEFVVSDTNLDHDKAWIQNS